MMSREQAGYLEARIREAAAIAVADLEIDPADVAIELLVRLESDEPLTITLVKVVDR